MNVLLTVNAYPTKASSAAAGGGGLRVPPGHGAPTKEGEGGVTETICL